MLQDITNFVLYAQESPSKDLPWQVHETAYELGVNNHWLAPFYLSEAFPEEPDPTSIKREKTVRELKRRGFQSPNFDPIIYGLDPSYIQQEDLAKITQRLVGQFNMKVYLPEEVIFKDQNRSSLLR